jgi:tetratricopeptide (TPR) repeat protein
MNHSSKQYSFMSRVGALLLLVGCICSTVSAQPVFDLNPVCRKVFSTLLSLRFAEAQQQLDAEKKRHPENLIPHLQDDYIDFLALFFNEDPTAYQPYLKDWDKRMSLVEQGPAESPFYLLTRAILQFHLAAVELKWGNFWHSGWSFRKAFLLVKENEKKFPGFPPNELYAGAFQVAAGTIPDGYRWLGMLLGISGSIDGGMEKLERFLQRQDDMSKAFHEEALFYYCYLRFYVLNDPQGAFDRIEKEKTDLRNNHLFAYLAASLYLNHQESDRSRSIVLERNPSSGYLQTPVWDLELGNAKLHHLEPDAAIYLERYIKSHKGNTYVRDVLQKLSWHYYLSGDSEKAAQFRKRILTEGASLSDADKQAYQEANSGTWPNKVLLKARLLNDGGYYQEALRLLHGKRAADFDTEKERLEFNYRVARIYDDLGRSGEAMIFYQEAIRLGAHRTEHFAARAALQLGLLQEKSGTCILARSFFLKCLEMKDHDFKNSLDQRAKAGLARCK